MHDASGTTDRRTLTDHTVSRIMRHIRRANLKPGDVLATEGELETAFGISRPILREAVSRLRALGFLESRQRVGLTVTRPDPVGLFERGLAPELLETMDLHELAELRYVLEIGSIRIATVRATEQQIEQLASWARQYQRTARGELAARNQDETELMFHRTLLEMTHNRMVERMAGVLTSFFSRMGRENPHWQMCRRDERSAQEHIALVEALRHRRGEQAREIMEHHLRPLWRTEEEPS